MPTSRLQAVLLLLMLALVLTTTGCRTTSAGAAGQGVSGRLDSWAATPQAPATEFWQPPLTPFRVTRPFRRPPSPYAAGHRGVDLAGSSGQEVRAAAAGTVSWAGAIAGRGVVVVSHGALRTTYEPVAATVTKGQRVAAGERVGTLRPGHPGCPTNACLHWGLLKGAEYLDPLVLLRHDVRLLPLGAG